MRALGCALVCVSIGTSAVAAAQTSAFGVCELIRPAAPPAASPGQSPPTTTSTGVGIKRTGWAEVDTNALRALSAATPARLRLTPFADATFEFQLERRASLSDGASAWFGTLPGIPGGSATLVLRDGVLAAAVRVGPRGCFDLRYAGDARYQARELDATGLVTCGGSPHYAPPAPNRPPA